MHAPSYIAYWTTGPGYIENVPQRTDLVVSDGVAAMGTAFPAWWTRKTVELVDPIGKTHYMTTKQEGVYIALMGMIARGQNNTSFRKVAASLGVCVATVANMARKLMAWGVLGYLSSRGRYGGVTLFARSKGDGLDRFARMAYEALKAFWGRRLSTISNVYTRSDRGGRMSTTYNQSSSVDIRIERDNEIEAHLEGLMHGSTRRVPCPAHGGQDRNLSFWRRDDGSLGVKCWSHQCTEREVKDAIVPWPR